MSLYRVRPLGHRDTLVAFEIRHHGRGGTAGGAPEEDLRLQWTLWDPLGRSYQPFPAVPIDRAMGGREYMARQSAAWTTFAARARRLFGGTPLSGTADSRRPLRGMIVFPCTLVGGKSRWTLVHASGARWNFTPQQLAMGGSRPLPPAG